MSYSYDMLLREAARLVAKYNGPADAYDSGEDPELVAAVTHALANDPDFAAEVNEATGGELFRKGRPVSTVNSIVIDLD